MQATAAPESKIPETKLPTIQKAALAFCAPEAQVVGGVAGDPRFCRFDPDILLCEKEETDACLTKPQAAALRKMYQGPRNIMRALEAWVEEDVAPDNITAAKYVGNDPNKGVAFTRPLCAYPKVRKYKGRGDINDAANFICADNPAPDTEKDMKQ